MIFLCSVTWAGYGNGWGMIFMWQVIFYTYFLEKQLFINNLPKQNKNKRWKNHVLEEK